MYENCSICGRDLLPSQEDICEVCELNNDEQMIEDREKES